MITRKLLRTQSWTFEFHKRRSDQPRDYHLHRQPPPHGTNHVFIMVKIWVSRSLEQNINWTTSQNRTPSSTGALQSVSLGNKTSESIQTRPYNYAERIKPHELNAAKKEPTKYPQEINVYFKIYGQNERNPICKQWHLYCKAYVRLATFELRAANLTPLSRTPYHED